VALPQPHRLKGQRCFDCLYRQGRAVHGAASPWRLGVVVSSKVHKRAVQRNRLRRLLHQHLLALPIAPAAPLWLLLSLKPGSAERDPAALLGECDELLQRAGLSR
jgi:ribonuclease P protein component